MYFKRKSYFCKKKVRLFLYKIVIFWVKKVEDLVCNFMSRLSFSFYLFVFYFIQVSFHWIFINKGFKKQLDQDNTKKLQKYYIFYSSIVFFFLYGFSSKALMRYMFETNFLRFLHISLSTFLSLYILFYL